jgi:outer membrane receptor protein involved in Fe transport
MSRFKPSLLFWLLPLTGAVLATAADDTVRLPDLTVNDQPAANNRPTVLTLEPGATSSEAFSDLARETPGFSINDAGARGFGQTVTLRGLGNTPFFSDSSAPVYLDDIPLATAFTFPSELYDFSRVTIYRGPQAAALFGRAGDAGVIQFSSAPATENSTGHLSFNAGNYRAISASATAQAAHTEQWDLSANVGTSQREGYIYNTQLNQTVDDKKATFGRIGLRYRPQKDLELSLRVLTQRSRDGAEALVPLGGPYFDVARGKEGVTDIDFTAVSFGVTRHWSDATITSTTSFTDWDMSPYSNRLIAYGGADFDSTVTQRQKAFNEEIRYVSGKITGGAFYSHSRTSGDADRSFSGFPIENSNFRQNGDSFALFGQANFTPAEKWLITPGLRFQYDSKDFVRNEIVPSNAVLNRDDHWNAFLPSISAIRHLDAATDLTFTLARGYKPGGYSAYTGVPSLAGYDPQKTWGLEAALSTAHPDSKWAFTSRAYAYRVKGYQIERSFAVPSTSTDEYLVVNADRARVLGLEVESSWTPMADVTVRAIAGLTDITLQNFTDPYTGISYSGKRAPYAPSGNAALRIDYRPARGMFYGAGVTWTGKTYYDEQETADLSQESYALFDATAGYAFGRGDIRLFGRNLADKHYYSSITPGVAHGTPGAPLTWGGEVNFRW